MTNSFRVTLTRLLFMSLAMSLAMLVAPAAWAQQPRHDEAPPRGAMMAEACPWADPDVEVQVEDTESGIALSFRGPPEKRAELERLANRMVGMHARMGHHRHGRMHDDGAGMGQMMMGMPAADLEAESTEDGVRLEFTPRDSEDAEALREHVRAHAEMMRDRRCPMRTR